MQGSLGGEYLRRSLDLGSCWEASGEVGVVKAAVPTISEAIDRFFEDAETRGLAEATMGKLNVLLRKQLLPWCRSKGYLSLKQLTVDELTQFRATWPDSPISKYKKQERLKGFFHFCVAREWVRTNPVLGIKPVKVPPSPTLPFEEEQMAAILAACDRYPIMGIHNHRNRQRMKALTLLMRYSGLGHPTHEERVWCHWATAGAGQPECGMNARRSQNGADGSRDVEPGCGPN